MPKSPFDRDGEPQPPGDRRFEQRHDAAVRFETRAARPDVRDDHRAEETIEEPGYGHGV